MPKKLVKDYLSPSDRLSEIMFGLIMAMTVIGSAKAALLNGGEDLTGRVIIIAALGCNIAWGLADAFMYVFSELFDRGKYSRLIATIKNTQDEEAAMTIISKELEADILQSLSEDERKSVCSSVFKNVASIQPEKVRLSKDDIAGAFVCFLLTFFSAFLAVIPFFLPVFNLGIKILLSRVISMIMLFGIGYQYAKHTGRNKMMTAVVMVILGFIINIVIFFLGG
jgi:VIT1/CCC1 family predicted Fe2+/Mn2+ transporter